MYVEEGEWMRSNEGGKDIGKELYEGGKVGRAAKIAR